MERVKEIIENANFKEIQNVFKNVYFTVEKIRSSVILKIPNSSKEKIEREEVERIIECYLSLGNLIFRKNSIKLRYKPILILEKNNSVVRTINLTEELKEMICKRKNFERKFKKFRFFNKIKKLNPFYKELILKDDGFYIRFIIPKGEYTIVYDEGVFSGDELNKIFKIYGGLNVRDW